MLFRPVAIIILLQKTTVTLRKVLNVTLRRSIWIRFAFCRENKDLRKGMIALEDGHL